jgi:hypothetical protein
MKASIQGLCNGFGGGRRAFAAFSDGGRISVVVEPYRSAASPLDLLTRQKALPDRVFARVPEAIVLLDTDDRVLQVNPEFTNFLAIPNRKHAGV